MKGFFITIALFVVGSFVLLTQYGEIGQKIVASMAAEEGTRASIEAAAAKTEAVQTFMTKYQPFLDRRWLLASGAIYLDEVWFVNLSKETLELYAGTPLAMTKPYANFMFERAKRIELIGNPLLVNEAFALYKSHRENFPNDEHAKLVINAISRMVTKYGMQ